MFYLLIVVANLSIALSPVVATDRNSGEMEFEVNNGSNYSKIYKENNDIEINNNEGSGSKKSSAKVDIVASLKKKLDGDYDTLSL
jgi:hypothetical protein